MKKKKVKTVEKKTGKMEKRLIQGNPRWMEEITRNKEDEARTQNQR